MSAHVTGCHWPLFGASYKTRRFGVQKGILNQADVVCCTCFGADHPMIQQMSFARVLLDEAAQATELSVARLK